MAESNSKILETLSTFNISIIVINDNDNNSVSSIFDMQNNILTDQETINAILAGAK